MAFADVFKTRRSAKLHQRAWQVIWERVKNPPDGDPAAKELHVVFVGTLLFSTRYQAAVAAGMEETTAKTVAMQVVGQAGFDEGMRDKVLSVFSASREDPSSDYATKLHSLTAVIVDRAKTCGGAPEADSVGEVLQGMENLFPLLGQRLDDDS